MISPFIVFINLVIDFPGTARSYYLSFPNIILSVFYEVPGAVPGWFIIRFNVHGTTAAAISILKRCQTIFTIHPLIHRHTSNVRRDLAVSVCFSSQLQGDGGGQNNGIFGARRIRRGSFSGKVVYFGNCVLWG